MCDVRGAVDRFSKCVVSLRRGVCGNCNLVVEFLFGSILLVPFLAAFY